MYFNTHKHINMLLRSRFGQSFGHPAICINKIKEENYAQNEVRYACIFIAGVLRHVKYVGNQIINNKYISQI